MPEDIAGGSYNPDEPDPAVDQVADYIDNLDMSDLLEKANKRPAPTPVDITEQRGPQGGAFREMMRPIKPDVTPDWAGPLPGFQRRGSTVPDIVDLRKAPEYVNPYLPGIPQQTKENKALLEVLDMRSNYEDPFTVRGYDPAHYAPITPLAEQAGVRDMDKRYANFGKFAMPDSMRDDYLTYTDVATAKGLPIPTYDKFAKEQEAESKVNSEIDKVPDWEGKNHPTQKDIDAMRENPTDQMLQAFEDQFGEGSAADYMDESIKGKVPLPRPRPREPANLPPITVEKKKRK